MEEISFKTKVFEGPLDLMLALIAKHKLNIMDIEITVLLEQFLLYIERMQNADIEVASEFMEMAARLIYIKTASLLPKHEVLEMKKELEGTLIEYALCKETAAVLGQMYIGEDLFTRKPLDIPVDTVYKLSHDVYILQDLLVKLLDKEKLNALKAPPRVKEVAPKSYVKVFTKIIYVLRQIHTRREIEVNTLYQGQTRSEQVAIFLALLELSKHGRVQFSEDNRYLAFCGRKEAQE